MSVVDEQIEPTQEIIAEDPAKLTVIGPDRTEVFDHHLHAADGDRADRHHFGRHDRRLDKVGDGDDLE